MRGAQRALVALVAQGDNDSCQKWDKSTRQQKTSTLVKT